MEKCERDISVERLILNKLLDWKNSPYRKPLILKGVRQVGKTWILKDKIKVCEIGIASSKNIKGG